MQKQVYFKLLLGFVDNQNRLWFLNTNGKWECFTDKKGDKDLKSDDFLNYRHNPEFFLYKCRTQFTSGDVYMFYEKCEKNEQGDYVLLKHLCSHYATLKTVDEN